MLLQVLILENEHVLPKLLSEFMRAGLCGSTVLDCEGALQVLGHSDVEEPPIFGTLRQFLNPSRVSGKIVLTALAEEELSISRSVIHSVVGDLSRPGTGIAFTLPISNVEGLAK